MDYTKYSAEDFALDEKFQKWVLKPDPLLDDFWDTWRKANPDRTEVMDEAVILVRTAGLSRNAEDNKAYLEVWADLQKNAAPALRAQNEGWRFAKIAAAVSLLIVGSFFLWKFWSDNRTLTYATNYNEVREIWLEDGSRVILNSKSKLSVTPDWKAKSVREVTLEGEAFFEVVKTSDAKGFEVLTHDKVKVSVLGTKFNVNTRHDGVKVFLQSGKVKVNSAAGEAMLNPGDFVLYTNSSTPLTINRAVAETAPLLSWKDEMFVFNDVALAEVIREIEDNYGLKVTVHNNQLLEKRITAKVPRRDVEVLLKVLSETLDIQVERDGARLGFR